ncbi:MAG: saccharopine dehydrogenase family protein, partial [Fidelibacterota bacterium]
DPWDLDPLAKEYNVTLAMDCGLAPGMSNLFCGYFAGRMDVKQFRCLVGGLPQHPTGPLKYKAVFSPIDVIEEYTRPARIVMDGEIQTVAALSDLEGITMAGMDLEAFNTDGLRTLLKTVNIENMVEKTIRYRGTTQYLTMLTDLGFFATSVLRVKDQLVRPIDVTAELLIPEWKMTDEDRDITLMQIMIRGEKNHAPYEIQYELIDRFDTEAGISSMARTTGFTATAVTNYILNGQWDKPGLCPMELLGRDENAFHFILDYLAQRGVNYRQI